MSFAAEGGQRVGAAAAAGGAEHRESSKKAAILATLRRPEGATLKQFMNPTGWQPHTVRGFIGEAVGQQVGLTVESTGRDGECCYRVTA